MRRSNLGIFNTPELPLRGEPAPPRLCRQYVYRQMVDSGYPHQRFMFHKRFADQEFENLRSEPNIWGLHEPSEVGSLHKKNGSIAVFLKSKAWKVRPAHCSQKNRAFGVEGPKSNPLMNIVTDEREPARTSLKDPFLARQRNVSPLTVRKLNVTGGIGSLNFKSRFGPNPGN